MFNSEASASAYARIDAVSFKNKYPSIEIIIEEFNIQKEIPLPAFKYRLDDPYVYIKIKAKDGRAFDWVVNENLQGLFLKDKRMRIWFGYCGPEHLRYIKIVHVDLVDP